MQLWISAFCWVWIYNFCSSQWLSSSLFSPMCGFLKPINCTVSLLIQVYCSGRSGGFLRNLFFTHFILRRKWSAYCSRFKLLFAPTRPPLRLELWCEDRLMPTASMCWSPVYWERTLRSTMPVGYHTYMVILLLLLLTS